MCFQNKKRKDSLAQKRSFCYNNCVIEINDVSYQVSDFRRRLWSARVVEEQAGKLPIQVDGHGLLRADRVNTEVVENVPLANLQGNHKLNTLENN
jgi:hypothetical protein